MTTTIRELLESVKHYPLETVVIIKDVHDQEFQITDFQSEGNTLNIIIETVDDDEEEEEAK